MRTLLVSILLVAIAFAGCTTGTPPEDTDPSNGHDDPTLPPGDDDVVPHDLPGFDGTAAFTFVEAIVYEDDGSLRPRHPTRDDPDATVDWLTGQMTVDGWTVTTDPFTGADYLELDHGDVSRYSKDDTIQRYCKDEDKQELPDIPFTNLYATYPSSDPSPGNVVLAAHWDAKEDTHSGDGPIPAANDGASGMGVLLELQRTITAEDLSFPFDLTIAFFDGEDGFEDCHPLAGSLWAARTGSLGDVSQLILLDMVGDPDARFIRELKSLESDKALIDALWGHMEGSDLEDNIFVDYSRDPKHEIADDHLPFIEEGVPAIDLIDAGRDSHFPPYWHTMEDTPDKLSPDMLGDVGGLMLWVLTDPDAQALLQD